MQNNIRTVEKISGGKVGYIYIPDMGPEVYILEEPKKHDLLLHLLLQYIEHFSLDGIL